MDDEYIIPEEIRFLQFPVINNYRSLSDDGDAPMPKFDRDASEEKSMNDSANFEFHPDSSALSVVEAIYVTDEGTETDLTEEIVESTPTSSTSQSIVDFELSDSKLQYSSTGMSSTDLVNWSKKIAEKEQEFVKVSENAASRWKAEMDHRSRTFGLPIQSNESRKNRELGNLLPEHIIQMERRYQRQHKQYYDDEGRMFPSFICSLVCGPGSTEVKPGSSLFFNLEYYSCARCGLVYKTNDALEVHSRDAHHLTIRFPCISPNCKSIFESEIILADHMRREHLQDIRGLKLPVAAGLPKDDDRWKPDNAILHYSFDPYLNTRNFRKEEEKEPFYRSKTKTQKDSKKADDYWEGPLECLLCEDIFESFEILKEHFIRHHRDRENLLERFEEYQFTCPFCYEKFYSAPRFVFHIWSDFKKYGGLPCVPECDQVFKVMDDLVDHKVDCYWAWTRKKSNGTRLKKLENPRTVAEQRSSNLLNGGISSR